MSQKRFVDSLNDDWGSYVARFQALSPAEKEQFLQKQGYARFADLLAHVIAWWLLCLRDLGKFVETGEYHAEDIDVDAFNAQAVRDFRRLDEAAAIQSFEHSREALLDSLKNLPEAAWENPDIVKRLEIETAGHYSEHEI